MNKNELFSHGEADSVCYCSPGLVTAADGGVLVFCEARLDNGKDDGPHHLVCKRSTDGGNTWGPLRILEESRGQCYMNPTPVRESESGRLLLCYALAQGHSSTRVFIRESSDHGISWSPPRELTSLFSDDPRKRAYHLPGPGHGIQMKSGRLVIPIWHRNPLKKMNANGEWEVTPLSKRDYAVNVIYSDDGGSSWHAGEYTESRGGDGTAYCMNEANICETPEGLILLARTFEQLELPYRYRCVSRDGGESFGAPHRAEGLSNTVQCYTGLAAAGENFYLLTRPDFHEYPRRRLTLYLSKDTLFWERGPVIESGFGAYSDIAVLSQDRIMIVYISTQFNDAYGKTVHCVLLDNTKLR